MSADEGALRAESQAPLINSLSIVFVTLSTLAVVLRIYTRHRILAIVGADDISIAVAQVLAIAVSVATCLEVKWGLGRHTQFVDAADATKQLRVLFSIIIFRQILTVARVSTPT